MVGEIAAGAPPRRTGSMWTLAIGLMLLGLTGCVCDMLGIAGTVMQREMTSQMSPEFGEFGGLNAMNKWLAVTFVSQILNVLFACLVLASAILVLLWHRVVPRLVPPLLYATSAFIVASTGLAIFIQYDVMSAMPGMPGDSGFVGMTMGFSFCMAGGWGFAKIAFFVWCAMYLSKPENAALFGGRAPAIGPRGD